MTPRWPALALALCACAPEPGEEALPDITLRVVSYNLRHNEDEWERRFPLIADEIVRLKPDLVGLQEVEIPLYQADELAEMIKQRDADLEYRVYTRKKSGFAGDLTGEGIGVLSLHEIDERSHLDLSEGRVALQIRVTVQGHVIDLFDTHLHSEGADDDIRLEQAQAITAWIDETAGENVAFLTGDMNDTPESPAITHFVESGFVDTHVEANGAEGGFTSPVVLAEGTTEQNPSKRIDYIFAREHERVSIESSEICFDVHDEGGLWASDHLGVMTTFAIRGD